jgi:hypothetical protein
VENKPNHPPGMKPGAIRASQEPPKEVLPILSIPEKRELLQWVREKSSLVVDQGKAKSIGSEQRHKQL